MNQPAHSTDASGDRWIRSAVTAKRVRAAGLRPGPTEVGPDGRPLNRVKAAPVDAGDRAAQPPAPARPIDLGQGMRPGRLGPPPGADFNKIFRDYVRDAAERRLRPAPDLVVSPPK